MKKNARSRNRRSQTPKPRNEALARAMQDKRRGSATSPVPSGTTYRRPAPGTKWS